MKSMTGYSRKMSKEVEGLRFVVEIHSVNRKHLDVHMHLPRELLFLDIELRKWVSQVLHRGAVTVKVSYTKQAQSQATISLLKILQKQWQNVAKELALKPDEITLTFLLDQVKNVADEAFTPSVQDALKTALNEALIDLVKMQESEGKALEKEVTTRLETCAKNLKQIETLSHKAPAQYKEKLQARLKELLDESLSDERLLKEVALFAEKVDVTEEIVRLNSHFAQVKKTFSSKGSIGRSLDFLMQEMMRETNTISAKTQDLEVTKLSLEMKQELEKIREQVQNIE